MLGFARERSPGVKFALVILVGVLLAVPLAIVWGLTYDRQLQSQTAQGSITEGWGGPQVLSGPMLAIPYVAEASETVIENGQSVTRSREVTRELLLAPDTVALDTQLRPERRQRSIYEAVVYDARTRGRARFSLPADIQRTGVSPGQLRPDRAELRFGLSDARGIVGTPELSAGGRALRLQPGGGSSGGGSGFFAFFDAAALGQGPVEVAFSAGFRGNASLALQPHAGDTTWRVRSPWPHPSFAGGFLPADRRVGDGGFDATWRVGNLALGRALVTTANPVASAPVSGSNPYVAEPHRGSGPNRVDTGNARVELVQPVDLYDQVNRATKYGFLFIGFTFLAYLLFDIIGGVRVSAVEYLLVGAGLILFFVLLLAFAEVIGFTAAYLVASAAIVGLLTAYSAAVLGSWRRAGFVGGLLAALYVVLYVLLSLEAYSLLIGSLLLFAALAGVMYLTRNLEWGGRAPTEA